MSGVGWMEGGQWDGVGIVGGGKNHGYNHWSSQNANRCPQWPMPYW